jgi:hypothetical protein
MDCYDAMVARHRLFREGKICPNRFMPDDERDPFNEDGEIYAKEYADWPNSIDANGMEKDRGKGRK